MHIRHYILEHHNSSILPVLHAPITNSWSQGPTELWHLRNTNGPFHQYVLSGFYGSSDQSTLLFDIGLYSRLQTSEKSLFIHYQRTLMRI